MRRLFPLALLLLLAGCTAGPPTAAPRAPGATAAAAAVAVAPTGPVRVPAHGVYVGAWAKPVDFTEYGRIDAVDSLQAQLGRKLDIVHSYRKWTDEIGEGADVSFVRAGATLMVSWAGADNRMVAAGRYDDVIRVQAARVKALRTPILLRYRWEMDRPNLRAQMWSGPDYVAAWKHVRALFAEVGAVNVSWVWCPTAEGFAAGYAGDFYPGDAQVDWTCVDAYTSGTLRPLAEVMRPFLTWAAGHPRPIIVGEYGISRKFDESARAAWLRDAAGLFATTDRIRAISYFHSDPEGNDAAHQYSLGPASLAAFRDTATTLPRP